MTKTSPVIGALKIPPKAPATPQPTSNIRLRCSKRNKRPKLEPIAAPVITIGDSAPTEPPKLIVMPEARRELHVL